MRYLAVLVLSCLAFGGAYFSAVLALAPAPIVAEYWVREMMVIKRSIAARFAGQRKVIVASGSSTLFNIDAAQLGKALGVPAVNYGLHAALSLRTILDEAGAAAGKEDVIVLALEPHYYCIDEPTAWQARNAIAWNREQWARWTTLERVEAIATVGPVDVLEMAGARMRAAHPSGSVARRLAALDDARTLARFASALEPSAFEYSAYHMDGLGNMRMTEGSNYADRPRSAEARIEVCPASVRLLRSFVERMRAQGVAVYFANSPFVLVEGQSKRKIEESANAFRADVSRIAPVLDSKAQLVFPRNLFFNTDMHLNAEGRARRTHLLVEAMLRDEVLVAHLGSRATVRK